MRILACSVGIIAIVGGAASALAGGPVRKGPYLQNLSKTAVTVMFETQPAQACEVVLQAPDGSELRRIPHQAEGVHEVRVGGLEIGRRYRYRVLCGREDVGGGKFATAPEATAPFVFAVFGDSRSMASSHSSVVERVRSEVPDFILGTGDMVNEGGIESDWQAFFEIEGGLLADHVLFPSVGNHDRQGRGRTADNFRKYFAVPENSPDPERYYAFTFANSRFLVLDSNTSSFSLTDQTMWIENQLMAAQADPSIRHVFVTMHHPPYSVALHGGHSELRDAWTPLFEKYRVDAVFSGHDHCYERMENNGVRYFVAGGGGAPLYPRSRRPDKPDVAALRYFERTNHFLRVHVADEFVEVSAFRDEGSLIETLHWGTPRLDNMLVAQVAVGSPVGAGEAEVEDGPGMELAPPEPPRIAAASAGGSALGPRGLFGGVLMVLAAGGLAWALRP